MNILEAIKSGLPFKRKLSTSWLVVKHHVIYYRDTEVMAHPLYDTELLADDWEVEVKKVTITLADLAKAYSEASNETYTAIGGVPLNDPTGHSDFKLMAKKLGLM